MASPGIPTLTGASSIVSLATKDPSGGGILVGGYVTGVLEDGGECTFTVTPSTGEAALVARTTGTADVDSTSCGSTTVALSHTGTFQVVLTYSNGDGQTSSPAVSVVIS